MGNTNNATEQGFLNYTLWDQPDNATHTSDFWKNIDQNQLIGVVVAVIGSFLISIALNLQKSSHLRLAKIPDPRAYYKSKGWWSGVLLMAAGELGVFMAYGLAPVTLIAPLGCVSVIGSAIISVVFLKELLRASDVVGGTLAITGVYLLVTFSPTAPQDITAVKVQKYIVSWECLVYLILEIILFCILLYFYKRKKVKHIVILVMLLALLGSVAVISVKAVSGLLILTVKGSMQLTYPIFYVMLVVMVTSCAAKVKFLHHAMQLFNATEVVPINFVFFTTSALIAGVIFYQECRDGGPLSVFMFLFGLLLTFLGVFLIAKNRDKNSREVAFITFGQIPGTQAQCAHHSLNAGKQMMDAIQPQSNSFSYGTLHNEGDVEKLDSVQQNEF
ncbi:NIPA-like protein 2 isoform X2 [Pleurodeles waltl]|uniref:NIPA-like protein 2 isoform X2 n=1 Tax=Pleurodeles waltl TaxID=8319 RepID=UPI0037093D6E